MIPIEIAESSLCMTTFEEQNNSKTHQAELDLVQEERELAIIREEDVKLGIARKYEKHVKPRNFKEGDLVLQKIELRRNPIEEDKLAPNWEGPYKITKVIKKKRIENR
ncbi:hypothetical protein Cni_G28819 [Canna indica]|uniref:Uncharacterized protein n=1 Tax=Canna indica TaxID=4628 RepID=A0AAQ3L659_9LILI|nr:hypothetical protein Cni_G28819 [Canna indica]